MLDIATAMPGASPAEVEERVTLPIENLVHQISDVEYVYSTSAPGQSLVIVRFLVGKAITQYASRYYYPPSAGTLGALAEKFGYSVMRDVAFSSVREFYPDVAAHYVRKHREKAARRAARRSAQPASP